MSTFDRAFIRAYAKDADLRGAAEPDFYDPAQSGDPHSANGPAAAESPVSYWPADRLYAEGAWYRIEPKQEQTPPPHVPTSWFSSPRAVASQPDSARSHAAPADVSRAPHAAEEGSAPEPSPVSEEPPFEHSPDSSASDSQAVARFDFTTQYMISATVNYPYNDPAPLPGQPSPGLWSPSALQQPPNENQPVARVEPDTTDSVNLEEKDADVARATGAEEPGSAPSSTDAPQTTDDRDAGPAPQQAAESEPSSVDGRETGVSEGASGQDVDAPPAQEAPARLDASLHEIPTPHFSLAAAKSSQDHGKSISKPFVDSSSQDQPRTSTQTAADPVGSSATTADRRKMSPVTLNPAWEVDAFAWPEMTDRLLRRESVRFAQLSKKLTVAADQGRNVVAVTSPARSQGRTTLSVCLARRLAADGIRVALVDADFDNPQLAPQLRLNPTCGWQDTVGSDLALDEAAVMSLRDGVTLFPLRMASVQHVDDVLDISDVAAVIGRLSRCFDVVLLDMEPVEPLDQAPSQPGGALHPAVAGLIVYNAASSTDQLAETISQLRAVGIETLGAVENQATPAGEV